MIVPIATLAAAFSLVAISAPAAGAAPTWLSPENVFSTPVTSIEDDQFFNRKALDVASDSGGDAVAVWIEEHPKNPGPGTECQAMYAFRGAGQPFGAPQPLAPAMAVCAGQIKAAMNANDTTVVAWTQGNDIDAAVRPPSGPFGAPATLSASASTDDPWVSINAAGVAAVSWDDTDTGACPGLTAGVNWVFHASVRPPGGGFAPFETVCDTAKVSGPTVFTPRVVVDSQGDVVATWVNAFFDGTNTHVDVESAFRPSAGSFTGQTPQVLGDMLNPGGSDGAFAADVAVDAQGRATAVWPFHDSVTGKTVIETSTRAPGASSAFSSPGPVSDPTALGDANSPRVAVDPSTNTAVAVWVQCPSSCQVEGSARPSGGGFQAPQALSGGGATTSFGPLVEIDPSGGAVAIWSGPSSDIAGTQVQIARRPPGLNETFGAVTTISTGDPSESPAVAFDGEGNAIAVWEHHSTMPPSTVLQYAGFDGAPPEIRSVTAPSGAAGKTLSFSADVFDRWSASTVAWRFGDGGTATGTSVTHRYNQQGTYTVVVTATDAVGNESATSRSVTIVHTPAPRVKLSVTVHAAAGPHGSVRFRSIAIEVSSGAKVTARCIGKHKGCPFKTKTVKTKRGEADLARLLRGHSLAAGAILQIRATKRGAIGRVVNLEVRHHTGVLSFLCLPIGKSKPRAHCAG